MTEKTNCAGGRNARPREHVAVRTTIVGGRPPGCGRGHGQIPRGIEILVKKAAVDKAFKEALLEKRAEAARGIGLELEPAEIHMLNAIPASQLETIISNTIVPDSQRRAFLGKVAAAMLAAIGIHAVGCNDQQAATLGIQPDDVDSPEEPAVTPDDVPPPAPAGVRPDAVPPSPAVSRGVQPDRPTKGLRPDPPPAPPVTGKGGSRPDRPPIALEGGSRPDNPAESKGSGK